MNMVWTTRSWSIPTSPPLRPTHTLVSRQRHRLAEPYSAHDMHPWPECQLHTSNLVHLGVQIVQTHSKLSHMEVSWNGGTPKLSILIYIYRIFDYKLTIWGSPIYGNLHNIATYMFIFFMDCLLQKGLDLWPVNWEASPVHVQAVKPEILIQNNKHAYNL